MSVIVYKSKIICQLEKQINDGKRLLIFDCQDVGFFLLFCEEIEKRNLSNIEIWHSLEVLTAHGFSRRITAKQMDEVLEIYRLYDFSDKVVVISEGVQYGSLFSYVRNGILTAEEMVDAILYKI